MSSSIISLFSFSCWWKPYFCLHIELASSFIFLLFFLTGGQHKFTKKERTYTNSLTRFAQQLAFFAQMPISCPGFYLIPKCKNSTKPLGSSMCMLNKTVNFTTRTRLFEKNNHATRCFFLWLPWKKNAQVETNRSGGKCILVALSGLVPSFMLFLNLGKAKGTRYKRLCNLPPQGNLYLSAILDI